MNRYTVLGGLALGLILSAVTNGGAGQSSTLQPRPVPAATFSQFECAGLISPGRLPDAIRVYNGSDDDLYEVTQPFTAGDYVYLRRTDHQPFHAGESYSMLRPENGFGLNPSWLPGMIGNQILPPSSLFKLQRRKVQELGYPYDHTGLVRVMKVTPQGAIAKVIFSCDGVNAQDIAMPYAPQPVPEYIPTAHLERFALPNGKRQGIIIADSNAAAYLARGSIAFLNIGHNQGVIPGQKYRIYAISHFGMAKGFEGLLPPPQTPRETLGELVILHEQEKASEGIVVSVLREIAIGDGVESE